VLRCQGVVRQRPQGNPCLYPPGHPKKIEELERRVAMKQELWHVWDASTESHQFMTSSIEGDVVNDLQPKEEREYQQVGQTGVEKDGKRWRVRCYWRGKKHNIGSFDLKPDALAAAESFWRDRLGLFAEQRDQSKFWGWQKAEKEVKPLRKRKIIQYYDLFTLPNDEGESEPIEKPPTVSGNIDAGRLLLAVSETVISTDVQPTEDSGRIGSNQEQGSARLGSVAGNESRAIRSKGERIAIAGRGDGSRGDRTTGAIPFDLQAVRGRHAGTVGSDRRRAFALS